MTVFGLRKGRWIDPRDLEENLASVRDGGRNGGCGRLRDPCA